MSIAGRPELKTTASAVIRDVGFPASQPTSDKS